MASPEIILIAALAQSSRVIGKNGKLPWPYIPEDSQRFQALTSGHAVIMGRKTWEFDVEKRPLDDRHNIVVSSSINQTEIKTLQDQYPLNLEFASSLTVGIERVNNYQKVFIIGGAAIYSQSLVLADTWELTLIEEDFQGDTFFPEYEFLIGEKFTITNLENRPGYRFETYKKII